MDARRVTAGPNHRQGRPAKADQGEDKAEPNAGQPGLLVNVDVRVRAGDLAYADDAARNTARPAA